MTNTATATATTTRRPAPDKSIDDLLAGFEAPEEVGVDAYAVEREARTEKLEKLLAATAREIVALTKGSDDTDAIKGALVSLQTVRSRGAKAIKSTPDSAITLTPAATPK